MKQPLYLLILLTAAIFFAEGAAALLLRGLPPLPPRIGGLVETMLLIAVTFPVLYHFFYRPSIREQLLEKQVRQSDRLSSLGQLAGGVAHDFNNLLTVILANCAFLLENIKPGDPNREDVEEIRVTGERGAALTKELLAFSRQQALQPRVLDLNAIIVHMDKLLRRVMREDIELVTIPGTALGRVSADPGQIERVIMNLVLNARDAMPQGGKLTIETKNIDFDEDYSSRHLDVQAGSYVMLSVSDNGIGMDEKSQARIFEPFFTTKDVNKGTGLGLATVFGIVKQSRGDIWVYSELGTGTVFKVYLPRADAAADTFPQKDIQIGSLHGTETILIVEDDESVRMATLRTVKGFGYAVLVARDGEEALQISRKNKGPIHLLLTDMVMPKLKGMELSKLIAVDRPETKVLFLSGYAQEASIQNGPLDQNVNFLQKPFTPDVLAKNIRKILNTASSPYR